MRTVWHLVDDKSSWQCMRGLMQLTNHGLREFMDFLKDKYLHESSPKKRAEIQKAIDTVNAVLVTKRIEGSIK